MKKLLVLLIVIVAAVVVGCGREEPAKPPSTEAAKNPDTPKAIPQKEAISGSSLNKVFPEGSGEFKITFTQEKDGFAQADLFKGGVKLAALTVSDTDANPSAREKFKSSSRQIGGYPAASVGSQGTAVLVGDRFQVQARSLSPSFTEAERQAWLVKFKLSELAAVRK